MALCYSAFATLQSGWLDVCAFRVWTHVLLCAYACTLWSCTPRPRAAKSFARSLVCSSTCKTNRAFQQVCGHAAICRPSVSSQVGGPMLLLY